MRSDKDTTSELAFDEHECKVLDTLRAEVHQHGGDTEFNDADSCIFYSRDYAYDEEDPDVIIAGKRFDCHLVFLEEGKYFVDAHRPDMEPGTFEILEYSSFPAMIDALREEMCSDKGSVHTTKRTAKATNGAPGGDRKKAKKQTSTATKGRKRSLTTRKKK